MAEEPFKPSLNHIRAELLEMRATTTTTAVDLSAQELAELEREGSRVELKGKQLDLKLRSRYAEWFLWLVLGWLVAVLILLLFVGFGWWGFKLADEIVVVALGTTTTNLIGLFVVIARFIFPARK